MQFKNLRKFTKILIVKNSSLKKIRVLDNDFWGGKLILTRCWAGASCRKVVDITSGGTTEQWLHCRGSCPACIAFVAKPSRVVIGIVGLEKNKPRIVV